MRRDEHGAALTMWVLLMVPVATFAALVAMAGPQRLAARADVADAADDLATLAAGLRHGYDSPSGELSAFSMDCDLDEEDARKLGGHETAMETAAQLVWGGVPPTEAQRDAVIEKVRLNDSSNLPSTDETAYYNAFAARQALVDKQEACRRIVDAVMRDLGTDLVLGTAGAAGHELSGTYSDSLKLTSQQNATPSERTNGTTGAGWDVDVKADGGASACAVTSTVVIYDAVHVAVAAEWLGGGWVASQVWPDGSRMAAESIGRFASPNEAQAGVLLSPADPSDPKFECVLAYLEALDPQGRPVWVEDAGADARELVQQAGRSSLGD
ncbi:MAG: hypothetical protein OXH86_00630 [Acidimicrobiaceae bacterium]|nr:hypothetical protein [Acidimicrobiaceae bacterium]